MDLTLGAVVMLVLLSAVADMRTYGPILDVCATCHPNATCDDKSNGSGKVCNCMYGFVGNGRTFCQDKDECQIGAIKICGQHTSCHNTYGSYFCTCLSGYNPSNNMANFIPNDGTHCQDIDECRIPGLCGEGGRCRNLEGSFDCRCQVGYRVHGGAEPFHPQRDRASCKVVDCGQRAPVEDTVQLRTTGTRYGSVVLFGCDHGFMWRSGGNFSTCELDGTWRGPTMVCEALCGPAPVLTNSQVVRHNRSVVLHSCVEGFHSWKGSNVSVCDHTGNWQKATLRCIEIKPAVNNLAVSNEKCLQWKAEKYEGDTEVYMVTYIGSREYQRSFCDKRRQRIRSMADRLEICLSLLPVTNYTISVTAVSAKFTATVTANTSLQVPQAPVIFYREVETPLPTLRLQRSTHTLDPISVYQVFVLPSEGTTMFDCTSPESPDHSVKTQSLGQYVTAQFQVTRVSDDMNFTVGDGLCYGGFLNAPLEYGRDYYIVLRAASHWKGAFRSTCVLWAKVRGTSYIMRISSLSAAGSIGLVAVIVLVGYSFTW